MFFVAFMENSILENFYQCLKAPAGHLHLLFIISTYICSEFVRRFKRLDIKTEKIKHMSTYYKPAVC